MQKYTIIRFYNIIKNISIKDTLLYRQKNSAKKANNNNFSRAVTHLKNLCFNKKLA